MKAVYIVNNAKIAKVLIDPMRRAILDFLRQKPMTQTQLAKELGLSPASLNYHIKLLFSKKLVIIAKKQVGDHGIMQIFYSSAAYSFVYDMDSLPKHIRRYFYPLSLERARAVIASLIVKDRSFPIHPTPEAVNEFAIELSRIITDVAKSYEKRKAQHGNENITLEMYNRSIYDILKKKYFLRK